MGHGSRESCSRVTGTHYPCSRPVNAPPVFTSGPVFTGDQKTPCRATPVSTVAISHWTLFSERSLYAIARPSVVCRLSVCRL